MKCWPFHKWEKWSNTGEGFEHFYDEANKREFKRPVKYQERRCVLCNRLEMRIVRLQS